MPYEVKKDCQILGVKKLTDNAVIPEFKTKGSAGFDICSNDRFYIKFGEITIVTTGIALDIPEGYEVQIRPRSGLAAKFGITIVNSPGTIDSDYIGEIKIIMTTLRNDIEDVNSFHIEPGDRIAQGVLVKIPNVTIREVTELKETERGRNGFGSTGIKLDKGEYR